MAASPVNFLFCFLVICITLWLLFMLLAWILSRVVGASIRFRFGGWKCIRDLVVEFKKMPKASIEVKELKVDMSKDGASKQNLIVKLQISPIVVLRSDPRVSCDLSNFSTGGSISASQSSSSMMERTSALFICEDFILSCEFGYDREVGVMIKNVDIACGEITVNLNEEMLSKSKSSSQTSSQPDNFLGSATDSVASKKPHKKQQMIVALSKYTSLFPEKVSFSLPKLDVRFAHREYDFSVENNIMGIQLKSTKSQSSEDVGETTRLDVQLDFSEIHLLREAGISVLEILKVDVVSLFYIPVQGCSQSSHIFANNISNTGTTVHMELGELNLHMADEYQECLKESLFGVESNSGSIINVAKVSLDWGKKDMESSKEDSPKCKLVLSVDVTGMGVFFTC
ncbi:protein SABRE-like isoform X4 [Malus domestica]|uniref:protein SABRE-like isoform X4 n=1 Tax=Malus domestica TaxID=3750 RepID=UPI00397704E0